MTQEYDIADISLASKGKKKIEWAGQRMKALQKVRDDFSKNKPLKGYKIGACLHITSETANLMVTLKEGGAEVFLCAANPLSVQNGVAASLVKDYDIPVFGIKGEDKNKYFEHVDKVIKQKPNITIDDGGDLLTELHNRGWDWNILGSSEETTTGVIRLRAMEKAEELKIPVIAVNDSLTKYLFDNRYGTGQSTVDGLLRATNILLSSKRTVVVGYGWCGRGVAMRLEGMGALVTVVEVDPVRALEAAMDGFNVSTINKAVKYGEIFITVTGNKNVISLENIKGMKDGAIIANVGHFNIEFDYQGLVDMAEERKVIRDSLEEVTLPNSKKVFVIAEGRIANLVAAEGHPSEVMDMSFANQALAAEYFVENKDKLEPKVYTLPKEIDEKVARLKLESMGINIDSLTQEQKDYLATWKEGTS